MPKCTDIWAFSALSGEFYGMAKITGVTNPKGSIGSLLAELFWGTGDGAKNGKIKPQYLDLPGITSHL